MNTQQLESFLQVAEYLNFARAAERLNITQSAVSRQIHALEEELGAKLFNRTTRTVSLTPEGAIFLEHAKRILGQLKIAAAKMQHRTNAPIQSLTIGCESETDLDFLCGILQVCRTRIPAFHPLIRLIPHRSLLNLFFQREIEVLFGFQENLPVKEDIVFQELGRIPLCCVVPHTHPYAGRAELDEEELYAQPLVLCDSPTVPAKAVELQNRVVQHVSPQQVYVSENQRAALTLIRAGYGCSILPRAAILEESMAYVPLRGIAPLSYGLICRRGSPGPVLRQFVEIARAAARSGAAPAFDFGGDP